MALWLQLVGDTGFVDVSGNGRAITLPGGTQNPTILAADANGHDAFKFVAGSHQYLTLPSMAAFTQGEAFVVVRINSQPPANGKVGLWTLASYGGTNWTSFPYVNNNVFDTFGSVGGTVAGISAAALTLTKYRVYSARITAAGAFANEFDGVAFSSGARTVGFPSAPTLGGNVPNNQYLDGGIAEFRMYDAPLSSTDRATLTAALIAAYETPSDDRVTAGFASVGQTIAVPNPHDRVTAGFLSAGQTIAAPGAPPINARVTAGFASAGQIIAAPGTPPIHDRVTAGWISVGQVIAVPPPTSKHVRAFLIM